MSRLRNRRDFLHTATAAGAALGFGDLALFSSLPAVSAADMRLDQSAVDLGADIEPLVRLLEETPRSRLLEQVAGRIQGGLTYRELLAALLLAGVRNVQPRPSVGFKFHAVLVVNSVHLAALASPEQDRWLPIFWALDYFKDSQARDEREGDWTMGPVDEGAVPAADKARDAFIRAMENWDEPAADAAVASLARHATEQEIFELFYRFGGRDFRSIGHKAIFVANGQRTLKFVGRPRSEAVLRSLAYALLMHEDGNPAQRDAEADRPWRENQQRLAQIRSGPGPGQTSSEATTDLLATLRSGSYGDAADAVVDLLNRGIAPQSIWDGLFCGAGELLLRQPGIVALHAVTTTNAIHFAYRSTDSQETQRLLLLQNAAFLPMFREAMRGRGQVAQAAVDQLQPAALEQAGPEAVAEILADVPGQRRTAVQKVLAYAASGSPMEPLLHATRQQMLLKGNDAHDYKFGSAALEDYAAVSPAWRDRYLAACMMQFNGAGEADSGLVDRTRAAFGS
jgi:hypothetical protein